MCFKNNRLCTCPGQSWLTYIYKNKYIKNAYIKHINLYIDLYINYIIYKSCLYTNCVCTLMHLLKHRGSSLAVLMLFCFNVFFTPMLSKMFHFIAVPPDMLSTEMSTLWDHLAAYYTIQGLLGDFSRSLMESLCCWKVARTAVLAHKTMSWCRD